MKINIKIHFSNGHTQCYFDVPCVPNVGDAVNNPKDESFFYYVARKSFYYLTDIKTVSIIITAEKK